MARLAGADALNLKRSASRAGAGVVVGPEVLAPTCSPQAPTPPAASGARTPGGHGPPAAHPVTVVGSSAWASRVAG